MADAIRPFGDPCLPARFWAKVDPAETGCWLWTAGLVDGYGRFMVTRQANRAAHRVAYEGLIGPIPDGLVLDHLCRVRNCVNPAHLEPVTILENVMRGETIVAACSAKTHCPKGHPYAGGNLYISPNGARRCQACARLARAAHRAQDPDRHRRQAREATRRYYSKLRDQHTQETP
ncbi:HNH endonuclease signature motif containing protein [Micromonospora sp. WMMD1128]|uniref:HNH endonuclease signature motif containing protein n=1 Tax=Micromonospora sp. WMMD1128 TaxID=3015150 RepID=UPI00248C044E|nr:HNH endonuclease signature motif containing protein [Micromonospora sp. WMMD1128]WBB73252.1 HNH endonuclease signature motif containing protein [Micromonospora sp. WMMD1128]